MQNVGTSVTSSVALPQRARLLIRESVESAQVTICPFRDKWVTVLMAVLLVIMFTSANPALDLPGFESLQLYVLELVSFSATFVIVLYILLWNLRFTATLFVSPTEVAIVRGSLPLTARTRRFAASECKNFEVGLTWQSRITGYDPLVGNYGARILYLSHTMGRHVVARGLSHEQTGRVASLLRSRGFEFLDGVARAPTK